MRNKTKLKKIGYSNLAPCDQTQSNIYYMSLQTWMETDNHEAVILVYKYCIKNCQIA